MAKKETAANAKLNGENAKRVKPAEKKHTAKTRRAAAATSSRSARKPVAVAHQKQIQEAQCWRLG